MKREKSTEKAPVKVYLTIKEHEKLADLSKASGYSRSGYMRSLLKGATPRPLPPIEFHAFLYELNKIGVNINQIAKQANATGNIDAGEYAKNYKDLQDLSLKIKEAFLKPMKKDGNN